MELYSIKSDHRKTRCTFYQPFFGFYISAIAWSNPQKRPVTWARSLWDVVPKAVGKCYHEHLLYRNPQRVVSQPWSFLEFGESCKERLYFEETDAKCLIGRGGNPKEPPKEYAFVTSVFLLFWTCMWWCWLLLVSATVSRMDAAVSVWWLQDPCFIQIGESIWRRKIQKEYWISLIRVNVTSCGESLGRGLWDLIRASQLSPEAMAAAGHARV